MRNEWPMVMLMSAATSAWLVYAAPAQPSRQALLILQYALPACTLCAVIGSAVIYATDRSGWHRRWREAGVRRGEGSPLAEPKIIAVRSAQYPSHRLRRHRHLIG